MTIEERFEQFAEYVESRLDRLDDLERRVAALEERGRQMDAAIDRAIVRLESGFTRHAPPPRIGGTTLERVTTHLKLERGERGE